MWSKEMFYNGKHYEVTVDENRPCNEDCDNCQYLNIVGEDDFIEICGKDGTVL